MATGMSWDSNVPISPISIEQVNIIASVIRLSIPKSIRRKCRCCRSLLKGDFPDLNRFIITETVSKTGKAIIQITRSVLIILIGGWLEYIRHQPMIKPSKVEPESPRKTLGTGVKDIFIIQKPNINVANTPSHSP